MSKIQRAVISVHDKTGVLELARAVSGDGAELISTGGSVEEAIENIDIGGPAMIRSSAKNWEFVAVVVDPSQYAPVLEELRATGGSLSRETRFRLAQEAFRRTAQYDAAIAAHLRSPGAVSRTPPAAGAPLLPPRLHLEAEQVQTLRYGENPHHRAAFYP